MYLTLTQIRIKYVVLIRPHVLVRISQSNTRSNTVQIHQIRTVLHRISTFRLLLLGDTSDDSVPPLYMSTDTREYCINMPYSSTCQIRIKYTSNTQSNTSNTQHHQVGFRSNLVLPHGKWTKPIDHTRGWWRSDLFTPTIHTNRPEMTFKSAKCQTPS